MASKSFRCPLKTIKKSSISDQEYARIELGGLIKFTDFSNEKIAIVTGKHLTTVHRVKNKIKQNKSRARKEVQHHLS